MRKHKLLVLLLALVMVVSTALVGCGKKAAPEADKTPTGPDADQYLNVAFVADVRSLDSAKVTDLYSATALLQTNEGLIRVTNDGEKDVNVKAGAEDWTVSADGTVYTFKLRDSKWSDGQPVTAKDYEYAWKRAINPLTKSGYSYLIYPLIKGALEVASTKETDPAKIQEMLKNVAIVAKDDKTLEVTLNAPCPYFEKLLGMQTLLPQRQDKVEAAGETYGQDPAQLVYNGPFTIQEWTKGSKLVLKKNTNYWNAANVKLETVNIPIIKDENARMKAFEANETDSVGAVGDFKTKYEAAAKNGDYVQLSGFEPSTNYIFFNAKDKNKVFTNRDIRMHSLLLLIEKNMLQTLSNLVFLLMAGLHTNY
jgi:oligopeptide transport system substrate-binding protein